MSSDNKNTNYTKLTSEWERTGESVENEST